MSTHSSSEDNNSDSVELDPDFIPSRTVLPGEPSDIPLTRLRSRNKKINILDTSLVIDDKNPILEPTNTMANSKQTFISLETAIKLVPQFNGENPTEVYPFFSACDFVNKTVEEGCQFVLLQAILTKLTGKAFTVTQHREVKTWEQLKELLEVSFCAQRTPGYLQLELSTTRHKSGETIQEYSSKIEKLLHDLCNVSTSGKAEIEAKAIHNYIKQTTLTTYVEGLPNSIRNIIKSRNLPTLEDAIKESLEEEKIFLSNKETQRLLQNKPNTISTSKYCKKCQKTNHNTSDCRYINRTVDTGQYKKPSRESDFSRSPNSKYESCSYCKKTGHSIEQCYKKKGADERKNNLQKGNNGQPSTSGNGREPGTAGIRPVRELKIMAQNQEY